MTKINYGIRTMYVGWHFRVSISRSFSAYRIFRRPRSSSTDAVIKWIHDEHAKPDKSVAEVRELRAALHTMQETSGESSPFKRFKSVAIGAIGPAR